MVSAEEAAAENLRWRAVNMPSTVQASEQAQAAQYASQYWNVERPQQQARDAAVRQTIISNRAMIDRQEGWTEGGTHTQPQLAAHYGNAERGRQAYAREDEYYDAHPSAEFQRLTGEYEMSRNRVVSGNNVSFQGPVSQKNPYPEDTALGIAWEVSRTGGATDINLNRIAESRAAAEGVDASFIRYATDIYQERPQYEREVLTTREGQQFTNEEWHGVPIRMNLTRAEMAAGGGITPDNYNKFLRYDDTSHLLNRIESGEQVSFGIDPGVHKARGDFGGPILEGGAYGGWRSPLAEGRLVGRNMVAGTATVGAAGTPRPFISKIEPPKSETGANVFLSGFALTPGLQPFAAVGRAFTQEGQKETRAFASSLSKLDVFGSYDAANRMLAPVTTDITGLGKRAESAPDVTGYGVGGDVANFVKGAYSGASQYPLDIAATYGGGAAFSSVVGGSKYIVAKAAMSSPGKIQTAGRALSSPFASDVGRLGMAAVGGFTVYEAGKNIMAQETATGKGSTFGRTAIQFTGFGVGYSSVKVAEPANYYSGREFFSGKLGISPIERVQFKTETTIRSLMTSNPKAYREVATIAMAGRTIEPSIRAEPDFSVLSTSGKYATQIKSTIVEQPHSVIGSSATIQQYPRPIAESTGLRIGKDVDVLIESPSKALTSLSRKTGLTELEASGMMDVHPIPKNYPGYKPSTELEVAPSESGVLTGVFGDPYRSVAFPRGASEIVRPGTKGYRGELSYESAQVQFGRKASGTALLIENPIQKGYRGEKDIYDFITTYKAQRAVAISRGTPESQFKQSDIALESFMERTLTYGTEKGQMTPDKMVTRKVRDIYQSTRGETELQRKAFFESGEMGGRSETSFVSSAPRRGAASVITRSIVFPSIAPYAASPVISGGGYGSPSPKPSTTRSPFVSQSAVTSGSRIGSSTLSPSPRSPSYPSRYSSIASAPPVRPAYDLSAPPTFGSTISRTTSVPPSSPPPYTPPLTPPTPPPAIPGGFLPGGGGGSGHGGNLGVTRWQRENLVATKEYLGRGIGARDFGFADDRQSPVFSAIFGSKKSKRKKNPFGFR